MYRNENPLLGSGVLIPCPLYSSLSRPHQPCYPGCWRIAHHRQPYDPGACRCPVTEPHAAPGLSLSPSLRAACVCSPACVDVLRGVAIITRRLSSEGPREHKLGPLRVAPMPGRPLHCAACPPAHSMGAKTESEQTSAKPSANKRKRRAVVGKLRLDRLTPDHHTCSASARHWLLPAAPLCMRNLSTAWHTASRRCSLAFRQLRQLLLLDTDSPQSLVGIRKPAVSGPYPASS